jgi:hypothetical protein
MHNALPERADHLRQNVLAWGALVHFLPADLLREFCHVTVDLVGAGKVQFSELFEEKVFSSMDQLDCWEIRPKSVDSPIADYLQRRIRTFAWGNDNYVSFEDAAAAAAALKPSLLEGAVQLGMADLGAPSRVIRDVAFPPSQQSIIVLRDGIAKAQDFAGSSPDASESFVFDPTSDAVQMPLTAVMVKHLGDLWADADRWPVAHRLYSQAAHLLEAFDDPMWKRFCDALKASTTQSIAAALWSAEGPRAAADYLVPKLEGVGLDVASLFIANASQDAYVVASLASDRLFISDRRAHLLLPPLLLSSHDLSSALRGLLEGESADIYRRFWQLLRRQIALGSASESRLTKAFYARAVFEELDKTSARHRKPDIFLMAVRLLIESGQSTFAEKMTWAEELVRSYVDDAIIQAAIAHAEKYSLVERLNAVVEMFTGWAQVTVMERMDAAHAMIGFLAKIAKENRSSFYGSQDLGGRSIRGIRQIAEVRPEFRDGTASEVTTAVIAKLRMDEWWTAIQEALKTASLYADVLPDESLTQIVTATISLLNQINPTNSVWVIVQPALDFLSSRPVKRWSRQHSELAEQIITIILDFCIKQQTEHARLLFFLDDFDRTLLIGKAPSSQITEVVSDVRNKAKNTSASDAVYNINALLVCPEVSGPDGVRDALHALDTIFGSALGDHASVCFAWSYETLNVLAVRHRDIARALSVNLEEFHARIEPLLGRVKEVWNRAKSEPMIFRQFSLPPQTRPNAIIVHNWAFSSINFAKVLHREDEMLEVLATVAKEQSSLADSIAKARAGRLAAGDFEIIDLTSIGAENRETFYSVLGRRLMRIRELSEPEPFVKILLDQCLRHGPNGLDAAVFIIATDLKLNEVQENLRYVNYERRLENNRDLRLALSPLLEALKVSSEDE